MRRLPLGTLVAIVLAGLAGIFLAPAAVAQPVELDTEEIVRQLTDHGLYLMDADGSASALREVVAQAKKKDVDLGLVVIGRNVDPAQVQTLANELMVRTGKSVLVMTPRYLKAESKTISGAENQRAEQAAIAARDNVTAARAYVAALTSTSRVWLWVVGGFVILAAAGGIWYVAGRSRRAGGNAPPADPAATTAALRSQLGGLSGLIIDMSARVDLADRPDLTQRFNEASATYAQLLQRLAQPLTSQREADRSKAEIDALSTALRSLHEDLSRQLPGMQPPAPAG